MPSIIKKGTNASAFRMRSGKTHVFQPDIVTTLSNEEYDELMAEYGAFIRERRITDAHPAGCFIIHDSREYVEDQSKEIADEIQDNSAPIKVTRKKKK
jgi:hypothetical protein